MSQIRLKEIGEKRADGVVAINLNIPEGMKLSFEENETYINLKIEDPSNEKIVEQKFYCDPKQLDFRNTWKMYLVIQNMVKNISE